MIYRAVLRIDNPHSTLQAVVESPLPPTTGEDLCLDHHIISTCKSQISPVLPTIPNPRPHTYLLGNSLRLRRRPRNFTFRDADAILRPSACHFLRQQLDSHRIEQLRRQVLMDGKAATLLYARAPHRSVLQVHPLISSAAYIAAWLETATGLTLAALNAAAIGRLRASLNIVDGQLLRQKPG